MNNFYKQSDNLITKTVNNTLLVTLINSAEDQIFELSGVGLEIWNLLEGWIRFEDLLNELDDNYESLGEAEKEQVSTYLNELLEKKLIIAKES